MSQSTMGLQKTFKAAGDLSAAAKQFTFVKFSAAQTVTTAAAGELAIGVQQNLPNAAGLGVVVRMVGAGGTSKLRVDGNAANIAAGDKLKADANGKGLKAAGANDDYYAVACEASTADGDVIEVVLQQGKLT